LERFPAQLPNHGCNHALSENALTNKRGIIVQDENIACGG
jgi:hypothetical protein